MYDYIFYIVVIIFVSFLFSRLLLLSKEQEKLISLNLNLIVRKCAMSIDLCPSLTYIPLRLCNIVNFLI